MKSREELEEELKVLQRKFNPKYNYIDNYTQWSKQNNISKRIDQIKSQLKEDNGQGNNK